MATPAPRVTVGQPRFEVVTNWDEYPGHLEAVEMVDAAPYDVVFMDVQMPEMDGLETAAAIRRLEAGSGSHVPIVAMTAHAMHGDSERCLEAGMDAYLSKPFRPEQLFHMVENLRN